MVDIELLAPAQNLDVGRAAIDSGADAVYIGAPQFGARSRAGNSLDDIAALVRHAHTYWARVYVTVNTLLHDDELPQAVHLLHQVYDAGVDAAIVQDVGLLECDLPPLPLIASTQMHNHTPERVAFLEAIGFRRVILARELSLEQIRAIRARTSLELECFVHGALCVSYSGQCYMSYAIGGRSGNRGECAQPCRRRYPKAALSLERGYVVCSATRPAQAKHMRECRPPPGERSRFAAWAEPANYPSFCRVDWDSLHRLYWHWLWPRQPTASLGMSTEN